MDASTECIVSAPAGVALATFLLLGDQNAGKSTFLHSFSWYLRTARAGSNGVGAGGMILDSCS